MIRVQRPGRIDRGVELSPEIAALIGANAPVAIGVSGGKDSCALAIAVVEHLRAVAHTGPVVLVHADLGRAEWRDSLRTCERLSWHLSVPLVVVRRQSGDMVDRWFQRWDDNVRRYVNLECVKVILPWSTSGMRFCTSELKIAVICRDLVSRFPDTIIVSAAGIRRSESTGRKNAVTSKPKKNLTSKTHRTTGWDWNAIAHWDEADVYAFLAARGFALHEGYTKFGMSRISCAFCVLASEADLRNSATNPEHHDLLRELVGLEVASTFGFHQSAGWLADVDPSLIDPATREAVAEAKRRGAKRDEIEAAIPEHLLYTDGWPTVMPTWEEAVELCRIRREVGALLALPVKYTEPAELTARYAELMAINAERAKRRKRG